MVPATVEGSVAIIKKAQYDFPKMRGGGVQRPFGTFPKIHPFWKSRPSLRLTNDHCEECYMRETA